APDHLVDALAIYRREFKPSEELDRPYAMVGVALSAAGTDAEAGRLVSSLQQQFLALHRGHPGPGPAPVDGIDAHCTRPERLALNHMLREAIVGSPDTVHAGLRALHERTQADEWMFTAQIYDHSARLRSFELAAEVAKRRL